jgi:L-alanine-DL-glutamate epimerase-like enolase superfamily enzyme
MHISEISAYHVRIPLKKTIRHASHARSVNETLIVRCRLDDGTEGWGEGLPRPYVTGESIQTAWDQFHTTNLKTQLSGAFSDFNSVIEMIAHFEVLTAGDSHRDCFGNSVKCAIELSVLDAAARREGIPLSALTQLIPETVAIRKSCDQVRYSAIITSMSPAKQTALSWGIRLYGFQTCKVKVGMEGVDDTTALKRIRRSLGKMIDLRIDANEAWHPHNLEQKIEELLPFGISSVEQPVPHEEVDGLAAIRKRLSTPIMLDESLCSIGDAQRAIERGYCDLFNIRLSKCGGIINSLKLAAMAHRAGLEFQLGCQVGETGILSAAGRHFSTSVGKIRYLEGSYDRYLVKERLTEEDLTFHRGGRAPALTGAGLGVQINQDALKRVTISEDHWKIV